MIDGADDDEEDATEDRPGDKGADCARRGPGRRPSPIWRGSIRFIRTRSTPGRSSYFENAGRAFDPGVGADAEAEREREVEKLHAKIGQLTVERDFLATRFGR